MSGRSVKSLKVAKTPSIKAASVKLPRALPFSFKRSNSPPPPLPVASPEFDHLYFNKKMASSQLIDDQPKNSDTSPVHVPQVQTSFVHFCLINNLYFSDNEQQSPLQRPRSKSRTIIRMLTTKLSTPRQPNSANTARNAKPPAVVSAYSKEQREAALRERGLLPPLPMSQQEAMLDQSIPIVSTSHTRDTSQPSAADLIKKEWETKNNKPSNDERERMNGFKFGASSTSTTDNVPAESTSAQHRRGVSSDIGHGSFSRAYNQPLPPSPSPHPPSSYPRSASPVSNPRRRNTTAAASSSSSPVPSRTSSPPPTKSTSPPVSIPTHTSRALPETQPPTSHVRSASSVSPPKPSQSPTNPTARAPLPDIPHHDISPANPTPNGDNPPLISLTPPSIPLPPTPPTRRSTVGTPSGSRAPSRAGSRAASPLPQPPPQTNKSAPGTPSRSRAGSSSGPKRLEHKQNEESFSSLMEKSIEAVFAGMSGSRNRSGSKTAADLSKSQNPSRSTSPTPVPTPRPNQSPTGPHDALSQSQSIPIPTSSTTATSMTASSPIPTSSFLQAHKRTPTNTTSLSDTLSTSPPPSLFSNAKPSSPAAGELSASGSSSASGALTSDTSAESSPNLPAKPTPGIPDRVMHSPSKSQTKVLDEDPLDTPPPIPVKNLKLPGSLALPKGKLGALSVKTKDGKAPLSGAPEVVISPGPVGGAFVMLTPGGSSDVEALSPRSGARSSDELDVMSDGHELMSDEDEGGMDDVKSQSAHTEGHLMMGGKGKRVPKRGMTDPGSPAPGNKFASSVSASGHGSNVRTAASGGATSPLPAAKSGWMSSVKRSVVGTLVRRGGDKDKEKQDDERRGRPTKGFNASHLPPSPTAPVNIPEKATPPTPNRSKTLSPSSPPPAPSSFWSRAPTRANTRSPTLSPPTSPRGFSYYGSNNNSAATAAAVSPRKAVSPIVYNAGDISKQASAIEDEETRRMTELAFMG
ncbi:hypothetical protein BJ165DRAFT_1592669 [Panaeolus papilionaceus]|nr:hypothetical protein BJ165DRAFT_1592669 [Panaeolus papilionaceus]